jgi:hypothetical protein
MFRTGNRGSSLDLTPALHIALTTDWLVIVTEIVYMGNRISSLTLREYADLIKQRWAAQSSYREETQLATRPNSA